MNLSDTTQAILLLTAHFPGESRGAKPLTPTEWGRFAGWLHQEGLTPDDLISASLGDALTGWDDKKITEQRIEQLLNRGSALALAMEKWSRAGLWVMTRRDGDYPERLKNRLRRAAPAVLFGCGNRSLLGKGGLAVVGSRKAVSEDLEFARELGRKAAWEGVSVVSGGAKGVDETAMLGALDVEGTAVGVLANNLLRASASRNYRRHLQDGNLVLVSPFNPEASFQVGNAMQRNRYIYCLSDGAVAVHAGQKGGTKAGAEENIKQGWVPMWVKSSDDPEAANAELLGRGAKEVPTDLSEVGIRLLLGRKELSESGSREGALLDASLQVKESPGKQRDDERVEQAGEAKGRESRYVGTDGSAHAPPSTCSIYERFLSRLAEVCQERALKKEEIVEEIMRVEADSSLTKKQITLWIDRAYKEGQLTKHMKPVRYEWGGMKQLSFEA